MDLPRHLHDSELMNTATLSLLKKANLDALIATARGLMSNFTSVTSAEMVNRNLVATARGSGLITHHGLVC